MTYYISKLISTSEVFSEYSLPDETWRWIIQNEYGKTLFHELEFQAETPHSE
jgi:hypothetical protein